jgi:ABC-type lipoprotein export system ATPase subunit
VNLLPDFDIMENMLLAAEISGVPRRQAQGRALSLMKKLGLDDRLRHRPSKLSLGEQQRAAIARALVHKPSLVLADEPTASLDAENAKIVTELLLEFCVEAKALLLVATHDETVQNRFLRVVKLRKAEGSD